MDDPDWWKRSRAAEDLTPQFSFALHETVYVGRANSNEQLRDPAYQRPLRLPSLFAREPLRPTAHEVLGREAELATYYQEVMDQTGRKPDLNAVNYWLRLDFVSDSTGERVGFPWWDAVSETHLLFEWLRSSTDTDEFFDCDQGWLFRAGKIDGRLHFQHGNVDNSEVEYANLHVERSSFLMRLDQAETDIQAVIVELKARLGIDPWS